jgi:eukaryotic translation initiation factor 2-alpha kinase 4
MLESDQGRNARFAASQNRKLLREVTTISRMTHINIVRYYQAWIEDTGSSDNHALAVDEEIHGTQDLGEDSVEIESASSEGSGAGWWVNSPIEESPMSQLLKNDRGREKAHQNLSAKSSEKNGNDTINQESSNSSSSIFERIESSKDLDADMNDLFPNPLLSGFDVQKQKTRRHSLDSSNNSDDEVWDESSVKISTKAGKSILYIQMEYCSTTLRELIDNRAVEQMTENEVWRLVRQILDALCYLHSRNVIHRDLVSFQVATLIRFQLSVLCVFMFGPKLE